VSIDPAATPLLELPSIRHDDVFRTAMSNLHVARSFLEHHLPAVFREGIDWDSLKVCPTESVGMGGKRLGMDMLYEFARLHSSRKTPARKTLVFVSVEHQRRSEPQMAFRMLRYKLRIWSNYRRQHPKEPLPLVASVVVYNGHKQLADLFDASPEEVAAQFTGFELIDLSGIPDQELMQERSFGLLAVLMKHAGYDKMQGRLDHLLQEARRLAKRGELQLDVVHSLLMYALAYTAPEDYASCKKLVDDRLHAWEEEDEDMPRAWVANIKTSVFLRELHEEAKQEGMQQGMQQGRQEGIKQSAQRMIEEGFSQEVVARVLQISPQDLARLLQSANQA
jgi:predicted transposase/invertase (TIGR01784 family)